MAKKKTKLLKLMKTFRLARESGEPIWAEYSFADCADEPLDVFWGVEEIKQLFGRVLCPAGKTATVKITIEVEAIE